MTAPTGIDVPAGISFLIVPAPEPLTEVVIGHYGGWQLRIMAMIFNNRLIMTDGSGFYDFGWCFPKGGAALLAALAWDPDTEAEPAGYIKRAHLGPPRTAGLRLTDM